MCRWCVEVYPEKDRFVAIEKCCSEKNTFVVAEKCSEKDSLSHTADAGGVLQMAGWLTGLELRLMMTG